MSDPTSKLPATLLIAICTALVLYAVVGWTGALSIFNVTSTSMEPNYEPNSLVLSTTLFRPGRNDVVVYKDSVPEIPGVTDAGEETFLGRLVTFGGDTLELRGGHTYINGQATDTQLPLLFGWMVPASDFQTKYPLFEQIKASHIQEMGSKLLVFMTEQQAAICEQEITMKRLDLPLEAVLRGDTLWGAQTAEWTLDKFGPVVVPYNEVFILGDNRHNAQDSRYRGFIPANKVVAKVLN